MYTKKDSLGLMTNFKRNGENHVRKPHPSACTNANTTSCALESDFGGSKDIYTNMYTNKTFGYETYLL